METSHHPKPLANTLLKSVIPKTKQSGEAMASLCAAAISHTDTYIWEKKHLIASLKAGISLCLK